MPVTLAIYGYGGAIGVFKKIRTNHFFTANAPPNSHFEGMQWIFLRINHNEPQTLEVLKANVEEEIINLEPDVLRTTIENAVKRAQLCINSGGSHLSDIIFSK